MDVPVARFLGVRGTHSVLRANQNVSRSADGAVRFRVGGRRPVLVESAKANGFARETGVYA